MVESSNNNREKIIINFELTQSTILQQSLASLSDPEFNPKGTARVDITNKGFEITVRNDKTNAAGYLFLKSSGLINFHCKKPVIGEIIDIDHLYQFMVARDLLLVSSTFVDDNDDTATIFQFDGSNYLTFKFGSNDDKEHKVEFLEMEPQIEAIPDISFFCEAVFTSVDLRDMIKLLESIGPHNLVSVNMEQKLVSAVIDKQRWIYDYQDEKFFGTRGVEPGLMFQGWFVLRHLQAMRKASCVAPCLLLCFVTEPDGHIMLRFCLRQLGDLVFLNEATPKSSPDVRRWTELQADRKKSREKGGGSEDIAEVAGLLRDLTCTV